MAMYMISCVIGGVRRALLSRKHERMKARKKHKLKISCFRDCFYCCGFSLGPLNAGLLGPFFFYYMVKAILLMKL